MHVNSGTPKILSFFLSPQETYRSPLFSPAEIFCGPDAQQRIADGRVFSLKTPVGRYDAAELLDLIPQSQRPELLIVKADATQRNLPRNLRAFRCPKILLVGDTHHFTAPLRTLIGYAQSEPFDYIVFDHTRHHAHWFARAGLRNLHWLPAVDFGFMAREPRSTRSRPLTFAGQVGRWHPWRSAVLSQVRKAGLPLEVIQGSLSDTADCYADSEVTLNVSLNGDLNLRVFEALGAGGFLLTDELSEASGMRMLFEPGRHLDVWRGPGELIEKIRFYLGHPSEVTRIREEGRAEVLRSHHPDVKVRELLDLAFSGKSNPRYDLGLEATVSRSFAKALVDADAVPCLAVYERIQEIHRSSRSTTVYCSDAVRGQLDGALDLPRLFLRPLESVAPSVPTAPGASGAPDSEVLWIDETLAGFSELISRFTGAYAIAPNAAAARLAEWGFFAAEYADEGMGLFRLEAPTAYLRKAWCAGAHSTVRILLPHVLRNSATADECLVVAECCGLLKLDDLYAASIRRAVALDRNCQPALIRLACIASEQKDNVFAALALEEAARCGPLPAGTERMRLQLAAAEAEKLHPYRAITGQIESETTDAPLRMLLVTNLFPPQELGGYGRMMWEFARGLIARGHDVRILTGDADYLAKAPSEEETEMEARVYRTLTLTGGWGAGRINHAADKAKTAAIEASNASKVLQESFVFEPNLILVGNLDLLGVSLVHTALYAGYHVLHAVANQAPGFSGKDQPSSSSYWMAPCSHWNGRALKEAGYEPERMVTLYPGARIDRFYRVFLPDTQTLRIAYASIVAPYKGTHVLVEALARLHATGLDFAAEIAGEALDRPYADRLREYCARNGMAGKVSFTGFLDRNSLSALFARSNVLVFPSQFDEPFGISQVEAMASGLVVVTSGTGGSAEVVRDGKDGLVFKAGDSGALAARLHLLATDQGVFQNLQNAGQRRAFSFSVDSSVRQLESLAGELIEAGEGPSIEQAAVAELERDSYPPMFAQPTPAPLA